MTDTLGEDRLLDEETAIQQVLDGAFDEISRICKERWNGTGDWRTSIPARPEWDSDLILGDALRLAKQSVARLCARVRQLEELRKIDAEDAEQRIQNFLWAQAEKEKAEARVRHLEAELKGLGEDYGTLLAESNRWEIASQRLTEALRNPTGAMVEAGAAILRGDCLDDGARVSAYNVAEKVIRAALGAGAPPEDAR